jgi:hypothetical protein
MGRAAIVVACAGAASIASERCARAADHCQRRFAAACQTFGASGQRQAAAGSGF